VSTRPPGWSSIPRPELVGTLVNAPKEGAGHFPRVPRGAEGIRSPPGQETFRLLLVAKTDRAHRVL